MKQMFQKFRNVRSSTIAAVFVVALSAAFATDAAAACFDSAGQSGRRFDAPRLHAAPGAAAANNNRDGDDNPSIVGLWRATFLFGSGPDIYDQGFEQWHSDGTELMVDNGVPPILGNVCVGVWKQVAPRTFKLRHTTWNWDTDGHLTGTFVLIMTVKLDRHGNAFTGSYVADSYDLAGNIIPAMHVEGVSKAVRITVD